MATSIAFGVLRMGQLITGFLLKYPEVNVDLALNDRVIDLIEERFDVAIRIGPRVDPGLVARKIAGAPVIVCASKHYLKKNGNPERPQDLSRHNCLTYSYSSQETAWPFVRNNVEQKVAVSGSFRANNGNVLVSAATEGLGIIRQPHFLVDEALRGRKLVRVLPDWSAGEHAVYAVYVSRSFMPPKVRAFIDYLSERFVQDSRTE